MRLPLYSIAFFYACALGLLGLVQSLAPIASSGVLRRLLPGRFGLVFWFLLHGLGIAAVCGALEVDPRLVLRVIGGVIGILVAVIVAIVGVRAALRRMFPAAYERLLAREAAERVSVDKWRMDGLWMLAFGLMLLFKLLAFEGAP